MVRIHPLAAADAPMARAKKLAERMARRLENEDVGDVTIAVALLMSGVVLHYAADSTKAHDLTAGIRRLEDRFIDCALKASAPEIHDAEIQQSETLASEAQASGA